MYICDFIILNFQIMQFLIFKYRRLSYFSNFFFFFLFSSSLSLSLSFSLYIILDTEIHPFLPHILYDSLGRKGVQRYITKPLKEYNNGEQTLASSVEDDLTNSCGGMGIRMQEMYVPRARVKSACGYRNHPCLTRES